MRDVKDKDNLNHELNPLLSFDTIFISNLFNFLKTFKLMKQFKENKSTFLAVLEILSVDTVLNTNGKVVIRTEKSNVNKSGVWQFSYEHLNALARGCNAVSGTILGGAIRSDILGGSTLNVPAVFVEEGDDIIDAQGNLVINQKTGDTKYTQNHFKTSIVDASITLTEEAIKYVNKVTLAADISDIERERDEMRKKAQELRRQKMMRATTNAVEQQPEDSGDDSNDDDDELMDIFDSGDNAAPEAPVAPESE